MTPGHGDPFCSSYRRSVVVLRVCPHPFGNGPPVLSEGGSAHEKAEMAGLDKLARDVLGRSGNQIGKRPDLLGRRDVVLGARQQEDRAVDRRQVYRFTADHKHAARQFVVDEQMLDDPEVEGAGQILCPFEPVGEVDVPGDVVGIADVGEQAGSSA